MQCAWVAVGLLLALMNRVFWHISQNCRVELMVTSIADIADFTLALAFPLESSILLTEPFSCISNAVCNESSHNFPALLVRGHRRDTAFRFHIPL